MGKLKNLFYKITKQNTMEDKLERGDVTYEEAMDHVIHMFAEGALGYWETQLYLRKKINEYNSESVPLILKTIDDILDGKREESRSLDLLFLKTHKSNYADKIYFKRTHNIMSFSLAIVALEGFIRFSEMTGRSFDKDVDMEYVVRRCMDEDIKTAVMAKNSVLMVSKDYYPNIDNFRLFYDLAWKFRDAAMKVKNINDVDIFNEEGILVDEDRNAMEYDVFKDYIHVDYKELV